MSDKKRHKQLLDTIKSNFEACEEAYSHDYKRNKEDTAFALGDQWEEKIKKQRKKFKQVCLTENRLLPFALKTINEIRKARPSITVRPVDDAGDIETADVYSGLIRNIQYTSSAENDYDTSSLNAILSARGFIKVGTRYSSYDSFDQEIDIDCVKDPFKGYLDPSSTELDGSDATYFIEHDEMPKEEFKRTFPDAKFDTDRDDLCDWYKGDRIRVVDYFYKEYETKELYQYIEADGSKTNTFDKREGEEPANTRTTQVCKIKHCRATGEEILQENDIVGQMLPIVPVYGLVAYKNGKREVYSLIHQAKDPQKNLNYWKSASAEVVALQPKAPWIGAQGSFANNAEEWARANIENVPFLEYKPVELENGGVAPPPQRQSPPAGSAIMVQEAQSASDGIEASLGVFAPSMGQVSNEVSGVAINQRQMQGDNATYHFVDNLIASMRQVGKIIVNMIPEVYGEQRIMRILGEDGESNLVAVNQPVVKQGKDYVPAPMYEQSEEVKRFDLDNGKYDVVVDIAPSYATRRQETFALMRELMNAVPSVAEAAPDLMVKSFDVQYADEIVKRIRAVMPPELLEDDVAGARILKLSQELEQAMSKLEQTELALQVKEQNEAFSNELKSREVSIKEQQVINDTMETRAKIKKLEAEATIEIPAEAGKDVAEAVKELRGQVNDVMATVGLILDTEGKKRLSEKPQVETEKETSDE